MPSGHLTADGDNVANDGAARTQARTVPVMKTPTRAAGSPPTR